MAIENSITFGGVNSADFGIYISGEGVFNAPERNVEMIEIPGRNGELALDKGRFKNIEVTYPAFNFEPNDYDTFAKNLSDFRNAICSQKGYQRLSDTFHPDEYRMATYIEGLEVKPIKYNTASEFDIVFNCKPQRYLTSGEEPITIGEWRDTETVSGDIVEVENPDGLLGVKSLSVSLEPIQSLNGYDKPWSGGNGKNKLENASDSYSIANATYHTYTVANLSSYSSKEMTFSIVTSDMKGKRIALYKNGDLIKVGNFGVKSVTATMPTLADTDTLRLYLQDYTADAVAITGAQLELGSTATSWTPYSNICPISGRTECVTPVSGVNVWDEEYQNGYWSTSDGTFHATSGQLCSKNYISVKPNTAYYYHKGGGTTNGEVLYFDVNKTFISSGGQRGNQAFATPSNCCYIQFNVGNTYGSTYNNDISINYPSTDTDYHAYNGQTYTTTLGRTVYGGTLEQVGGSLTDSMILINLDNTTQCVLSSQTSDVAVFDARFAWNGWASHSSTPKAISNRFSTSVPSGNAGRMVMLNQHLYFVIAKSELSSIDESGARAWLNDHPTQVCYELATPQTYQLTETEVELVQGANNVWSDGSITLEYGQLPNIVNNPTLFESSPLLEVEGYGSIGFNDYSVTIENEVLGEVLLSDGGSGPLYPDFSPLNNGDSITVKSASGTVSIKLTSGYTLLSVTAETPTWSTGSGSVSGSVYSSSRGMIEFNYNEMACVYGTASTLAEVTVPITLRGEQSGVEGIKHEYLSITWGLRYVPSRNSFETISPSVTHTGGTAMTILSGSGKPATGTTWGAVYGDSTKSVLGHPTYIDCDLGEAYKYEDDSLISLNGSIDLGSDLPTLASGANTVTFDNTITDLKIVPRWWKI